MGVYRLPRQITPFVGRQQELGEILSRLDNPACQLLNLLGPGGSGKTRLAIEVAHRKQADFAQIVYVMLQPLSDINRIAETIVASLELRFSTNTDTRAQLLAYFSERHLLLILDNCEHLLDGSDFVAEMIQAAPQMKVLTTSREPLKLQQEWLFSVNGMAYPINDEHNLNLLDEYDAVRLFCARARQVQPGFSLDEQRDAVLQICRLVEGLPLALELSASWMYSLTCAEIAEEIKRGLGFLSSNLRDVPERHRSMRAVFDHSWRLLSADEQRVLPRLSVFEGGFTQEAAEVVAGAELYTLVSLIEKSLLHKDGHTGRYNLHELVRQYAQEQLELTEETEVTLDTQCAYFLGRMQAWEVDLKGQKQIAALDAIEADFENVRAGWQRAVQSHQHTLVAQSVECLFLFCSLRSRFQDHKTLFTQAISQYNSHANDEAAVVWGRILVRSFLFLTADHDVLQTEAVSMAEAALSIARVHNAELEIALCTYLLAQFTRPTNEAQALRLMTDSYQLFVAAGDVFYRAYCLGNMSILYSHIGQLSKSRMLLQQTVELCRTYNLPMLGRSLSMLGMIEAFGNGNYAEGERYVREAANFYRSLKSPGETARILRWVSNLAFVRGDFDEAQQLAQVCHDIAYDLQDFEYLGGSSAILAMLYNMQEDYHRGESYGREALRYGGRPPGVGIVLAEWSLGCAYCGLGDFATASDYLRSALRSIHNMVFQTGFTALFTPIAACIYAHADNLERSVELLAMAFTHPKSAAGWLEKWPLIMRLRIELEGQLGMEAFAATWARGMSLDPKRQCVQLLQEFDAPIVDASQQTGQWLPELLSRRELEVLGLIAGGLTNREIADQLFISGSTVKKHIQHIYAKLDTKNRTSAVMRARELNLLP